MKHKSPGGTFGSRPPVPPKFDTPAGDYTDWRSPSATQALKRVSSGLQSGSKRIRRVTSGNSIGKLKRKNSDAAMPQEDVEMQDAGEDDVMLVPDGMHVPPLPAIPYGVEGQRAHMSAPNFRRNDGFGGYIV